MKGKKWLGMLTALSLCASMLAGCGSAAASEEKADTAAAGTTAAGTTAESGAAESSTAAEGTNFDEEVELLMYCIGAVSYTHLDVYKRQGRGHAAVRNRTGSL